MKNFASASLRASARVIRRCTAPYREYDNSSDWKQRASCAGEAAVLWRNQAYNELYREQERDIIAPFVAAASEDARILDVGCGIGVVSKMVLELKPTARIDAVDFSEMIEAAKDYLGEGALVNLIAASADNFCRDEEYELIISSGCYSAIRDLEKMFAALDNGIRSLQPGGTLLMIDPFHRWKALARARISGDAIIEHVTGAGLTLVKKSGVLFWPYREILANSGMDPVSTKRRFNQGESLLGFFGDYRWSDYKILVFKKPSNSAG